MKSYNSPESKNRKRKVALNNLEKALMDYNGLSPLPPVATKRIERIKQEITTLKSRITK